jgi:hypothetical protein
MLKSETFSGYVYYPINATAKETGTVVNSGIRPV